MVKTFISFIVAFMAYEQAHADVVGTFKWGKHQRNVVKISDWQASIYKKMKVPFQTQLYLRTLNTMECGDQDGFCVTPSDAGPFQVNQIHGAYHKWSRNMANKGKEERACVLGTPSKGYKCESKKGDWSNVAKIRDELFESQARWTWQRMARQVVQFKLPENRETRMTKLAKLHNGGPHKEDYAKKALKSYIILKNYYALKNGKEEGRKVGVVRPVPSGKKQVPVATMQRPAKPERASSGRPQSQAMAKFLNAKF